MSDEENQLEDGEISEIIYNLVSVHETLSGIDGMVMDKGQQNDLDKWKNKIWDAIGYYISMLPE